MGSCLKDRGQKTEVSGQRAGIRCQRSEDSGQRSERQKVRRSEGEMVRNGKGWRAEVGDS